MDSSDVLDEITPGGLKTFKILDEIKKKDLRELAIQWVAEQATINNKAAVITGHNMFWSEGDEAGASVHTSMDLKVYTHMLYFEPAPQTVASRCAKDTSRIRPEQSVEHLQKWQQAEQMELRDLCYDNSILYPVLDMDKTTSSEIAALLLDLVKHNESHNLSAAITHIDHYMNGRDEVKTMLVFDADKTLAPYDAGSMFWKEAVKFANVDQPQPRDQLKHLFDKTGYTYTAFHEATMMYEYVAKKVDFEAVCAVVAAEISM